MKRIKLVDENLIFSSVKEASEQTGVSYVYITKHLKDPKTYPSAKGKVFTYISDEEYAHNTFILKKALGEILTQCLLVKEMVRPLLSQEQIELIDSTQTLIDDDVKEFMNRGEK